VDIKISSSGFHWDRSKVLSLKCPNGHAMHVTLGELQDNATVRCSSGESVKLVADDFNPAMKKIEKDLNNLF
jgi:hypothetical protein